MEILAVSLENGWLRLGWRTDLSLERLSTVLLAGGYAATIVWAASKASGRKLLAWAAPIGRMAFTNYLMQSVIFGWVFYGYGLGLFGKLEVAAALAIGIGVYILQVVFSAWWLRRFLYGPVEWLWRSAMYGTRQPLWRTRSAAPLTSGMFLPGSGFLFGRSHTALGLWPAPLPLRALIFALMPARAAWKPHRPPTSAVWAGPRRALHRPC